MGPRQLKSVLGVGSLTLLGVGCIIGTGIFVLTGRAAAELAGPGLVISFLLTGGFCVLIALCYAELSSALPSAGSAYAYTYVSMGRFVGWVTGLLLLLAYGLAAATVAVGWAGYAVSFLADLGITLPASLTSAPGTIGPDGQTGAGFNAVAMVGIGIATVLLCVGVSATATVNSLLSLFKIAVVIAFIVIGAGYVQPANWVPLIPPEVPAPPAGADISLLSQILRAFGDVIDGGGFTSAFGIAGVIGAAAMTFFGFIGFEMPTTASEEAKNPRTIPFAMIASLIICVVLYIGTTLVLTGIVPYSELNTPAPVAQATDAVGLPWFSFVIKIAALAGLSTVMLTLLFAQTRVFLVMTRDGLMPPIFARLNEAGVPAIGTIATGVVAAIVSGIVRLDSLADLTNIGMLGVFALVCLAVMVLRVNSPELARPFKTPFYPIVPIIGLIGCVVLLASVITSSSLVAILIFFAIGLGLFFISGAWRSVARAAQSDAAEVAAPRAPTWTAPTPTTQTPPPPLGRPAGPPERPAPRSVPTGVSDVFISYKREEKRRVEGIAEALRGLGLNVWFDAKLTPGHDFDEEINREVRSAKAVFVCWSMRAVESRWVRAEASVGHKRNVLVACFLEPCEPWTPFNLVHAEDLSGSVLDGANVGWVKLVEQIGQQCGRPGLGAYLRLNGDRAAMLDWLRRYPDDPLAPGLAARPG